MATFRPPQRVGGPGLQDLIGNLQNPLGGAFGDRIADAPPRLNVAAEALDARQIERGATQQGDRLGLALGGCAGDLAVCLFAFTA
jgi:hypothetical protein